jgi:hypothetical protein
MPLGYGSRRTLLALAQENVPSGYANDLDDLMVLDAGSTPLTIIRR